MKPFNDIEVGKQLLLYGTVFIMARRSVTGDVEMFLLDRREVELKELQDGLEQIIRR